MNAINKKVAVPSIYCYTDSYRKKELHFKLGYTDVDVDTRVKQQDNSAVSAELRVLFSYKLDNLIISKEVSKKLEASKKSIGYLVEQEIHKNPKLVNIRKEWFKLKDSTGDYHKDLKLIRTIVLNEIDKAGKLTSKELKRLIKRYYQIETELAAVEELSTKDRASGNLCPRSGKTLTGTDIFTTLNMMTGFAERNLVIQFEPSRMLVSQNSEAVRERLQSKGYTVRTIELGDEIPTTLENIINFIEDSTNDTVNVITSTYQSSKIVSEALNKLNISADFMICDEAHRLCGRITKTWGKVLYDSFIPCKKRWFQTGSIKKYFGDNSKYVGFNNEEVFGRIVYTYTLRQGIADGYIAPFRAYGFEIDEDKVEYVKNLYLRHRPVVQKDLFDLSEVDLDSKVNDEFDINLADPAFWMQLYNCLEQINKGEITHPIIYANRVTRARIFVEMVALLAKKEYGIEIPFASALDSSMSLEMRNRMLHNNFKTSKIGVLSNVNCLKEGIDVSAINSVFFIDPKSSGVDLVQIIARALTFREGKVAKIYVPIIMEKEQDGIKLTTSRYKETIKWIVSLAGDDKDAVKDIVNDLSFYDGVRADGIVSTTLIDRQSRGRLTGTGGSGVTPPPDDMDFKDGLIDDVTEEFSSSDHFSSKYRKTEESNVAAILSIAGQIIEPDRNKIEKALNEFTTRRMRNIDLNSFKKHRYKNELIEKVKITGYGELSSKDAYEYLNNAGLDQLLAIVNKYEEAEQDNFLNSLI